MKEYGFRPIGPMKYRKSFRDVDLVAMNQKKGGKTLPMSRWIRSQRTARLSQYIAAGEQYWRGTIIANFKHELWSIVTSLVS